MRIAFADPNKILDYNVETPYRQPLGGGCSAVCYLAENLAKLGEEIFLITHTSQPGIYRGVTCLHLQSLSQELLTGLKQISSPNKAQTSLVSHEYVTIVVQPLDKTKRHRCPKCL